MSIDPREPWYMQEDTSWLREGMPRPTDEEIEEGNLLGETLDIDDDEKGLLDD